MADRDKLLFGAEPVPEPVAAPDSDGDGVSDLQERLDGTDPNDASSVVHHADLTVASADPQGDLRQVSLEGQIVVDVATGAPAGFTTDQSLGTGLDGKPIQADPNHLGIGDNKLLAGQGESNSIAGVERDPTLKGGNTIPKDPHEAMIETLGREPGPGVSTGPVIRGGPGDTPPPGETPSGSADPDHHPELVSGYVSEFAHSAGTFAGGVARGIEIIAHDVLNAPRDFVESFVQTESQPLEPRPKPPKDSVDPDAAGGSKVVVTEEDVARAITARDSATDVVQGFGGTQIEGDTPPKQAIDFVRDPIEKESTLSVTAPTPTSSGQEISHTINPDAGFDVPRGTSTGGSSGGGGDPSLYGTTSSAATAADSSADPAADSSGISVVGAGSSGSGIHTVAGDDTTSDAGRASQSSAMMAASGPGTQTEDEVYIGKTSAPADGSSGAASGGAAAGGAAATGGGAATADPILGLAPTAVGGAAATMGGAAAGDAGGGSAHGSEAEANVPIDATAGEASGKAAFDTGDAAGGAAHGAGADTQTATDPTADEASGKAAFDTGDAAGGAAHGAGADTQTASDPTADDASSKATLDSGDAGGAAHGGTEVPVDPVADAMVTTMHAVPIDEPAPTFAVLEVDDGLAVPDEVDLDDGF